ncbi:MAG: LytTR family DNA-binding domain-containing protein [Bacteroidia bacterium]
MNLRAVIIDDQQHFIDMLIDLCKAANLQVEVVATANNATDGFLCIRKNEPDIVFLDVEMPGKSGLDLAKEIGNKNFDIIFTTSHDKYAVQAFKTDAIDYLLKPIDASELTKAIDRIITKRNEKILQTKVNSSENKKITVSTLDGVLFVEVNKLLRLEADNAYTTLHLDDATKVVASKSLKDFEDRLINSGFIRIHKSHLINVAFIKKFYKGDNAYLVMQDESIIPVSKTGRELLQNHAAIL